MRKCLFLTLVYVNDPKAKSFSPSGSLFCVLILSPVLKLIAEVESKFFPTVTDVPLE